MLSLVWIRGDLIYIYSILSACGWAMLYIWHMKRYIYIDICNWARSGPSSLFVFYSIYFPLADHTIINE